MGCHFLLQCMKMKSESEVAQSCLTLSDPMNCSLRGSSIHGIFQARVLEWVRASIFHWDLDRNFSQETKQGFGNRRAEFSSHLAYLPFVKYWESHCNLYLKLWIITLCVLLRAFEDWTKWWFENISYTVKLCTNPVVMTIRALPGL